MEIIKDINAKKIERKLDNGLTEVKIFFDTGEVEFHYFEDENGRYHGEYKEYCFYFSVNDHGLRYYRKYKSSINDGLMLMSHVLYENDKIIKDYLHGNN